MKVCNHCYLTKPLEEFASKGKSKTTDRIYRSSICKICNKLYQKQHYTNNKEYYLEKSKKNKKEVVRKFKEIKSNNTYCVMCCLEYEPYQMDFHHVNEIEKLGNVSEMAYTTGFKKLLKEITKCIIVCSGCHRKIHFNNWTEQDLIDRGFWIKNA